MITKKQILFLLLIVNIFMPGYGYFILTLFCTPLVYVISTNTNKLKVISIAVFWTIIVSSILGFSWCYNSSVVSFDFFRDYIYLFKAINGFVIGSLFVSSEEDFNSYFKVIAFVCFIYLFVYFFNIAIYFLKDGNPFNLTANEFRVEFGSGEFLVAFVFIYFYSFKNNALDLMLIIILLFSIIVMQSRTMLLLIVAFFFYKLTAKKKIINYFSLAMISILLIIFFNSISLNKTMDGDSFASKVTNSIVEIIPDDYSDMSDIGYHWRGFESFWALAKLKKSNIIQFVFGYGAGAKVDLPIYMTLAGNEYNSIPFLHNGYLMVMIKGGFLSLFIFLVWHFKMLRIIHLNTNKFLNNQLLFSLIIFSLASTYFMSGIFEANDWAALLIIFGMLYSDCVSHNENSI